MNRNDLQPLILGALQANSGSASIAAIGRWIWENHRPAIEDSGDFFYVWQYELRWAGDALVRSGKINKGPPAGVWHLA